MSKRLTKLLSLLLVLVMFVSVTTPAFAWGGGIDIGDGWDREIGEDEVREFGDYDPDAQDEELFDYFQNLDEETGVQVTVEAPMGALPTMTEVRAEPVEIEDVRDAVASVVDGEHEIILALDISFWLGEYEIEPEEPVRVKISAPELYGRTGLTLVHIPDEEEPETIDLIPEEDLKYPLGTNEIVFESGDFSVYAVVGDNDSSENSRLQVRFFHHDDDTEPAYSVYVTQRDKDILDQIIEDPEIPATTGNQIFCGWYVNEEDYQSHDYTDEQVDGQHTIDYVRNVVKTRLDSPVQEGDTLNVYAMVYNYFNVAYVDENGETTLSTEVFYSKDNSVTIPVQLSYVPYLQGYRFYGWQKDDGDEDIYQNGSTTVITRPVTKFRAQVQQGFWLSFEENPGDHYKGATYVPPVFCPNGVIPADAMPADPVLAGYKLGDASGKWFGSFTKGVAAADDTWEQPFNFSGTISQDTTVYAKWVLEDTVPVTVIIWRQSVDDLKTAADKDKTYDYYDSATLQAKPNAAISALDLDYYKDLGYYGFKYNNQKDVVTADTVVQPNGTTVVNLYYDRELVTYDFRTVTTELTLNTDPQAGNRYYLYYGGKLLYIDVTENTRISNGRYYEFDGATLPTSDDGREYYYYHNNSTLRALTYLGYYNIPSSYYFSGDDNSYGYSNDYGYGYYWSYTYESRTYYVKAGNGAYVISYYDLYDGTTTVSDIIKTYTGLYGQKLSVYGYQWTTDYRWFNDFGSNNFTSTQDIFEGSINADSDSEYHSVFYGYTEDLDTEVRHYLQNVDGSWPANAAYSVKTAVQNGMIFRTFQGFSGYRFRIKLPDGVTTYQIGTAYTTEKDENDKEVTVLENPETKTAVDGWTDWLPYGTGVEYEGNTRHELTRWDATEGGIDFRYTRNRYRINYLYGTFVDGRGNTMAADKNGTIAQSGLIYYEASIDSYAEGKADYFDPSETLGNDSFVFEGWYVDPGCTTKYDFAGKKMPLNGVTVYAKFRQREFRVFLHPNLEGVSWNDPDQAMNFRIAYNGMISDGNPVEGAKDGYVLVGWYTDPEFTQPFNFGTKFTDALGDLAQPYGAAEKADPKYATEDDGTNKDKTRPWIDHMVHLYAKWRKVLPGATGITLVYDAIEQSDTTGKTGMFTQEDGTPTTWQDPMRYTDQSPVITRTASTPDDPDGYQFVYWEVLDKNGNPTDEKVYPGQIFTIDVDNAVVTDAPAAGTNTIDRGNLALNKQIIRNGNAAGTTASEEKPDTLDKAFTGASGTTYIEWSKKAPSSNAVYSGQSAGGNSSIQLRSSNSNSGIVSTTSGGKITKVAVTWNSNTVSGRTLNVYGSNSAYVSPSELYDGSTCGDRLGTIVYGTSTELVISGDYAYIGVRSNSGALYLENITFTWTTGSAEQPTTKYTVTFKDHDGTVLKTEEVEEGSAATAPADPTREGYTFAGWDTAFDNVQGNLTVTATYTINKYTVTFEDHDGTVLKTEQVEHGGKATAPADPSRSGYTFIGWDPNPANTVITSNLTITAQYSVEGYFIVTFKDWNGKVLKTEQVARGQSATAPDSPARAGFTFNGWDKDFSNVQSNLVVYATYATEVTKIYTVTLRAHYEPRVVQEKTHITWYANNGTGDYMNSEGVYMNENIRIPVPAADRPTSEKKDTYIDWNAGDGAPDLVWEDHVFLGWARVNESDLDGDPYWSNPDNHPEEIELGEADLFLKYDPTTKTFTANNSIVSYEDRPVLSKDYYLFGFIEGVDTSKSESTKFVNSELTMSFTKEAYVAVVDEDNVQYYTNGWLGENVTSATLGKDYDSASNKLYVPANSTVTFILNENKDGTLTLSYRRSGSIAGTNSVEGGTRAGGSGDWVDVDYVAADELKAYHAMYAVWAKVVYIYHSGTNTVERVVVDTKATPTLDLANRASENFLYGGYYKSYAGQGSTFDVKDASVAWTPVSTDSLNTLQTQATKGWLSTTQDATGTPYTVTNIPNITWNAAEAYGLGEENTDGMHVAPVAGTTYYIKEVPADKYLQPYFHYTYHKDTDIISSGWLISDLDDTNYTETGYAVVDKNGVAQIVSSLTVETKSGGTKIKLNSMRVFGAPGLLSYREVMSGQNLNDATLFGPEKHIVQYWKTPDGLFVTSAKVRTYANLVSGSTNRNNVSAVTVDAPSQILTDIKNYK